MQVLELLASFIISSNTHYFTVISKVQSRGDNYSVRQMTAPSSFITGGSRKKGLLVIIIMIEVDNKF